MKTFGKIKLLLLFATIALGMTSCLKSSDPEFQFGISPLYILQTKDGEKDQFRPVMRIYAYEAIKNASVKYTPANDKINAGNYRFVAGNVQTEKWLYGMLSDSIPNGNYLLVASNQEDKQASLTILADINKKLGAVESTITYNVNDGIKAEWKKVDNATNYCLLYRTSEMQDWAYLNWNEGTSSSLEKGTSKPNIENGTRVTFAVGAYYSQNPYSMPLIKAGEKLIVTWGTNPESAE